MWRTLVCLLYATTILCKATKNNISVMKETLKIDDKFQGIIINLASMHKIIYNFSI